MNELNPLRISEAPRTLREIALEKVRLAILDMHFKPGTRLTERDLGEQLGVSRSVVREVIRHLESEGLIEIIPNQGPIVARLDPSTAAEIYEIRGLLEGAAARAAAEAPDISIINKMKTALKAIEAAYERQDFRRVVAETARFYEPMFLAGNRHVAWEMVQRLNGRINMLRAMTIASPGREQRGPSQLGRILQAISDGKPDEAESACREHVKSAANIAIELLRKSGM